MSACAVALVATVGGCTSTPRAETRAAADEPAHTTDIDTFTLLRAAADHEALYTLAGGLKPMSTGIWRGSFDVDAPDLSELRAAREALAPLRNEIWYADVQVFNTVYDGSRSLQAFVVHREALSRMIERFESFWSPWGITPCTHPTEILAVADRMPRGDRWRAYGYLFGYPVDAIDFFVDAGMTTDDAAEIGPGKDRQFVQIPTYAEESGRFTYAVPLGHVSTTADDALADGANRILAAYTERRERMRSARSLVAELRRLNQRFEQDARAAAVQTESPAGDRGVRVHDQ